MACSLLAFRIVRPLGAGGKRAEDAELVAFWVGEHHPGHFALTYVGTAGAEPEQPLHLRLVRAVNWPQVQVQAVLDHLGFWNGHEHQRRGTGRPAHLLGQVRWFLLPGRDLDLGVSLRTTW
jgi:hypothetical protein